MAFLKLFHGRASPDEEMDGWGENGPVFGPYPYFHKKYGCEIAFENAACHRLSIVDGLVFYGGRYYGDWSIFDGPLHESDRLNLADFAPERAVIPQRSKSQTTPVPESGPNITDRV